MGKKKRGHPDIEEQLARPWCYYCERDFDDLKILINHQKAKHFKCERCGRRLNTAGGLSVHMTQVHKETLSAIDNALPNRAGLDVEIFGMEGIPDDIVTSHNQRVITSFAQAEAERRAATGNPGPGGVGGGGVKKPKYEAPSDLKKRLAEHKAKKAAEQPTGLGSGSNTPNGAGNGHQSPSGFQAGSPGYPQPAAAYGAPPTHSTYSSYPQPYNQQPAPYQSQQPPTFPQQSSNFVPPGNPQFPNNQLFVPPQQSPQFQPPGAQAFPPQYPGGPPQTFNSASSSVSFQANQYQPPRTHTPPQFPPRPGNLPPAPGLPQRPSFGAPPVNAFQMQQMHQGQIPGPSNPPEPSFIHQPGASQQYGRPLGSPPNGNPDPIGGVPAASQARLSIDVHASLSTNATSLDDLLSGAAKDADKADTVAAHKVEHKIGELNEEKKSKKEKDKSTKLVYSDNEMSPEEKMAQMPRYAFAPNGLENNVSVGATTTAAIITADSAA